MLAARNIAAHIEREGMDKPKDWTPLVYCWRGGQRSGSLALVLAQIGFRTTQLQGGYKAFRAVVREQLQALPARWVTHTASEHAAALAALRQAMQETGP